MIGKRIQELRKGRGLTLSQLAEHASVAKSYLSNVERGIQTNPSVQFLDKISEILGVTIETLLYDEPRQGDELDRQWYELAKEAMQSGISKQEFKEFLEFQKWKKGKG